MIDSVDIIRSIRKLLKDNFPEIKVMTHDIKTPQPACFYIRYALGDEKQSATEYFTQKSSYEIVYFSSKECDTELNIIKDKLKRILRKPLKVFKYDEENQEETSEYKIIEINNVSININGNDYFLNCLIDIEITELDSESSSSAYDDEFNNDDTMDDLIMNI